MPHRDLALALLLMLSVLPPAQAASAREAKRQLQQMNVEISVDKLVQYAAEGDLSTIELLLSAGVPIKGADGVHGATALHNAAAQGHRRVLDALIKAGAPLDAVDGNGVTPLMAAAW
ncbi:ankyrin repeat protein, partial [Tahibacter aquaticus]